MFVWMWSLRYDIIVGEYKAVLLSKMDKKGVLINDCILSFILINTSIECSSYYYINAFLLPSPFFFFSCFDLSLVHINFRLHILNSLKNSDNFIKIYVVVKRILCNVRNLNSEIVI